VAVVTRIALQHM